MFLVGCVSVVWRVVVWWWHTFCYLGELIVGSFLSSWNRMLMRFYHVGEVCASETGLSLLWLCKIVMWWWLELCRRGVEMFFHIVSFVVVVVGKYKYEFVIKKCIGVNVNGRNVCVRYRSSI